MRRGRRGDSCIAYPGADTDSGCHVHSTNYSNSSPCAYSYDSPGAVADCDACRHTYARSNTSTYFHTNRNAYCYSHSSCSSYFDSAPHVDPSAATYGNAYGCSHSDTGTNTPRHG